MRPTLLPALAVLALLPVAAAAQKAPTCGAYPVEEARHICLCPADAPAGPVWGNGPYTADSDICTAARHAGEIGTSGGRVILERVDGVADHPASLARGVQTSAWGAYPTSFLFVGQAAGAGLPPCRPLQSTEEGLACGCEPLADGGVHGPLWGSGPYTADSDICAAGRHAGVIGLEGGTVEVVAEPGLGSYPGSTANGVTSRDWGAYERSFSIVR